MSPEPTSTQISAWFTGPKAENGEAFAQLLGRVVADYHYWRRNYFPQDGIVVDSHMRREHADFWDSFDDKLNELLALLKADFPFHSPRYAAHMLCEQTLPSIAGYFAGMLYNPNNVTAEAAPVTVRLELEAAQMVARMLGYGEDSWAHITSGGTVANIEALWIARNARYLPLLTNEMRDLLGLEPAVFEDWRSVRPLDCLRMLEGVFTEAEEKYGANAETVRRAIWAFRQAKSNAAVAGMASVIEHCGSKPYLFVPETAHYCLSKSLDVLGVGRGSLVSVPVNDQFEMDVGALSSLLGEMESSGGHALAVVAVIGSTEEGAIDPLNELLDLRSAREDAGKQSFWIHADAAYGGYLRTMTVPSRIGLGDPKTTVRVGSQSVELELSLPHRSACDSLERLGECDSIAIDPHKLGYVPYPAGVVCFRSNLVKALARQDAPYIEEAASDPSAERSAEGIGVYILEGSKPGAAAASVWLSHKLIPLDGSAHGVLMRESVRNASELHTLLEQWPSLTSEESVRAVTLCTPGSNIVCYAFRATNRDMSLQEINALNRRLYQEFSMTPGADRPIQDQRFFVSRTVLSSAQYKVQTVKGFLDRLGVCEEEYEREGVFLLRSVLMNPWYGAAKARGQYYVSELVGDLFCATRRITSS
ncbi:MAG: Aspartate 1-decarboxylase [Fimbriimonadales bacterium]|nr:Aspartate 1-decarboxylase [Fimbriimonadales bacterium]